MAQFYYYEGHLYDNVFTWTSANGEKINKYRTPDRWDWWGDGVPSMAPIVEKQETTTSTTTTTTTVSSTTSTTSNPQISITLYGDANCDSTVDMSDIVLIMQSLANPNKYDINGTDEHCITLQGKANADVDLSSKGVTSNDALRIQEYLLHKIESLEPEKA